MARNFKRKEPLSAVSEINVTPLIDLAFSLLIIFMITTPLLEQKIRINLPVETARSQKTNDPQVETISVDDRGQLFLGGERITKEQLNQRLKRIARRSKPPVISVRGDANIRYQKIIEVIDLIKSHNLEKLHLETQIK